MFADSMDIFTLTMWRLTCKTNYAQAVGSLRRSLLTMLATVIPRPSVILDLVTEHRSVIGGEFALAFILRDPTFIPPYLDVYCSDHHFRPFCSALLESTMLRQDVTSHEFVDLGALDALRTLESRILVVHTSLGTSIRLHRSYTTFATAPISHASCTALSNFVTEFGFGCSHPSLTLRRLSLIADQELPHVPPTDQDVLDRLRRRGISFAFSPTVWSDIHGPLAQGRVQSPGPEVDHGSPAADLAVNHSAADTFPDVIPAHRLECGRLNPCGSCLCAVSHAPAARSLPRLPSMASSDRGVINSATAVACSTAPTDGPLVRDYAPSPIVGVSSTHDGDATGDTIVVPDNAGDGDSGVGHPYYQYESVDDTESAHSVAGWDILSVASIERPLYMGEIVYSRDASSRDSVYADSHPDALRPVRDCVHPPSTPPTVCTPTDENDATTAPAYSNPATCPAPLVSDTVPSAVFPSAFPASPFAPMFELIRDDGRPSVSTSSSAGPDVDRPRPSVSTSSSAGPDVDRPRHVMDDTFPGIIDPPICAANDHILPTSTTYDPTPVSRASVSSDTYFAPPSEPEYVPSFDETIDTESVSSTGSHVDIPRPEKCFRSIHLCPSQGRFFGDHGSFVDFFDPLNGGEARCARNCIPPFGPVVIWRVLSTFTCERGCDLYDDAIDVGVPPTPVVIRPATLADDIATN